MSKAFDKAVEALRGDGAVLRTLTTGGAAVVGADGAVLHKMGPSVCERLRAEGFLQPAGQAGVWTLSRSAAGRVLRHEAGTAAEAKRVCEDTLDWLAARKGPNGKAWIDDPAHAAGLRLRRDVEMGYGTGVQAMDLARPLTGGRRSSREGLSVAEAAIAARQRAQGALKALGPDMASPVLAVVTGRMGLEDVEKRWGWPRRSAKLVICLALNTLARHYGLTPTDGVPAQAWLDEDARPSVD
jgi:hypothetical protein